MGIKSAIGGFINFLGNAFDKSTIKAYSNFLDNKDVFEEALRELSKEERTASIQGLRKQFDSAAKEVLLNSDSLFEKGGDNAEKIYHNISNMVNNKKAYERFIERDYKSGNGIFSSMFRGTAFEDLSETQLDTLHKKANQVAVDFNTKFGNGKGFDEAQKTYRKNFVTKSLGDTPDSKEFNKRVQKQLKNAKKNGYEKELTSYIGYVNEVYENGSEDLLSERDYYSKVLGIDDKGIDDMIGKNVASTIASGSSDHSGLYLWKHIKNHPVIAMGIAGSVMFDVNAMTRDDDTSD